MRKESYYFHTRRGCVLCLAAWSRWRSPKVQPLMLFPSSSPCHQCLHSAPAPITCICNLHLSLKFQTRILVARSTWGQTAHSKWDDFSRVYVPRDYLQRFGGRGTPRGSWVGVSTGPKSTGMRRGGQAWKGKGLWGEQWPSITKPEMALLERNQRNKHSGLTLLLSS